MTRKELGIVFWVIDLWCFLLGFVLSI